MPIANDFLQILKKIEENIKIPLIKKIILPPKASLLKSQDRSANFAALVLEDGSVGIVFLALSDEIKRLASELDIGFYLDKSPLKIGKKLINSNLFEKTIAMGALNAISQFLFKKSNFKLDFTTDSLGLLDLQKGDIVGMVGFFPPLVKKIEKLDLPLIIIEKKEYLVKKTPDWEVTLDPTHLESCNKVLCTSTAVLNNTIDEVLSHCKNAEKISIIGPTAGFIPDPLFERGVSVIGGTYVHDLNLFVKLVQENRKWGPSTRKYCIQENNYVGFGSLLEGIK
ncbi:MAG: hypothetical protein GF383_06150 [Candidatus Lokiarchaeota archaeon]|nr:hypothetical protein [Candidatus Lokiarchaeota archaeon]MBD3339528.1 hypothetical protein [Candidatus Lokiarchaeota archaeon]